MSQNAFNVGDIVTQNYTSSEEEWFLVTAVTKHPSYPQGLVDVTVIKSSWRNNIKYPGQYFTKELYRKINNSVEEIYNQVPFV